MKRMILALSLLCLCFVFCASSYFLLGNKTDELIELLESASENISENNIEEAEIHLRQCDEKWKKNQSIFTTFLNHKMLESLNINVPSILPLLEKNKRDSALEKIEECINALKAIMQEQKISLGNIL